MTDKEAKLVRMIAAEYRSYRDGGRITEHTDEEKTEFAKLFLEVAYPEQMRAIINKGSRSTSK